MTDRKFYNLEELKNLNKEQISKLRGDIPLKNHEEKTDHKRWMDNAEKYKDEIRPAAEKIANDLLNN